MDHKFELFILIAFLSVPFLLPCAVAVPAEEWNISYPDIGPISDIAPTNDGGYVFVAKDYMSRIDASGNRQWIREYSNSDTAFRGDLRYSLVDQTKDGGYIFAGSSTFIDEFGTKSISVVSRTDADCVEKWNRIFDENKDKLYLFGWEKIPGNDNESLKKYLMQNFNIEWVKAAKIEKNNDGKTIMVIGKTNFLSLRLNDEKTSVILKIDNVKTEKFIVRNENSKLNIYDNHHSGGINSIRQTNDVGYILAESTIYDVTNDVRIIKLDSGRNTEWMRTFDNSLKPSVRQTLDGGYILSFSHENFREQYSETIINKLDSKGNVIWNRKYPKMDNVQVESTVEGAYVISGEIRSNLTNIDAILIKIDATGNELWRKNYGGTGDDGFGMIRKTRDGGFILAGYTGADRNTDVLSYYLGNAWLVRVDVDGNKLWDKIFGEFEMRSINSVRETNDGGYIFAGRTGIESGGWIVKLTNDSVMQGKK